MKKIYHEIESPETNFYISKSQKKSCGKSKLVYINSIEMHLFTINPLNHKPIMSVTLGRNPCRLG